MPDHNPLVTVTIREASLDLLRRLAVREANRAFRAKVKAELKTNEAQDMLTALASHTTSR